MMFMHTLYICIIFAYIDKLMYSGKENRVEEVEVEEEEEEEELNINENGVANEVRRFLFSSSCLCLWINQLLNHFANMTRELNFIMFP